MLNILLVPKYFCNIFPPVVSSFPKKAEKCTHHGRLTRSLFSTDTNPNLDCQVGCFLLARSGMQHGLYRRSHLYHFLLSSPAPRDNSILLGSYKNCHISMGHVDHRMVSLGSTGKSQVQGQYCWNCQEGRADSEGGRATAL